jgi:hypothetical protein
MCVVVVVAVVVNVVVVDVVVVLVGSSPPHPYLNQSIGFQLQSCSLPCEVTEALDLG